MIFHVKIHGLTSLFKLFLFHVSLSHSHTKLPSFFGCRMTSFRSCAAFIRQQRHWHCYLLFCAEKQHGTTLSICIHFCLWLSCKALWLGLVWVNMAPLYPFSHIFVYDSVQSFCNASNSSVLAVNIVETSFKLVVCRCISLDCYFISVS